MMPSEIHIFLHFLNENWVELFSHFSFSSFSFIPVKHGLNVKLYFDILFYFYILRNYNNTFTYYFFLLQIFCGW